VLIKRRFDTDFIPNQKKVETFMPVPRQRRTCNHNRYALVTAHRVYGDTRFRGHLLFSFRKDQATATTSRPL
jgi:hypothetical protein